MKPLTIWIFTLIVFVASAAWIMALHVFGTWLGHVAIGTNVMAWNNPVGLVVSGLAGALVAFLFRPEFKDSERWGKGE